MHALNSEFIGNVSNAEHVHIFVWLQSDKVVQFHTCIVLFIHSILLFIFISCIQKAGEQKKPCGLTCAFMNLVKRCLFLGIYS